MSLIDSSKYPAGPAAQLAEDVRANSWTSQASGTTTSGYPGNSPQMTCSQDAALPATARAGSSSSPGGAYAAGRPSIPEMPSRQAKPGPALIPGMPSRAEQAKPGPALIPGMPSRAEQAKPGPALIPGMPSRAEQAKPGPAFIPGIPSRSEQAQPGPALTLGIPSRAEQGPTLPLLPPEAQHPAAQPTIPIKGNYVTSTINTPLNRGYQTRSRPKPVSIATIASMQAACGAEGRCGTSTAPADLTKWGRCGSGVSGLSGLSGPDSESPTSTASWMHGEGKNTVRFDSSGSFRWAPEVLVQSWHRELSDTYRDFNMVDVIGEGRSGAVIVVQHKISGQYNACKVLNKADNKSKDLRAEIENLRRLDHPNVVRLYETIEDSDAVFLLMELCQGGDLFSRIVAKGSLPENEARLFAEQMLLALAYCHKMGVVHRDVKPENFLLESTDPDCPVLKLADFGIATRVRQRRNTRGRDSIYSSTVDDGDAHDTGQVHGSLPYMAPELFRHTWGSLTTRDSQEEPQRSSSEVSTLAASDMWSCGIVIYVMLSGDLPYGEDPDAIMSGEPPDFTAEVWSGVSAEATDLIRKLVNYEIKDRWTARQALQHEWFKAGFISPSNANGHAGLSEQNNTDSFGGNLERRGQLARELLQHLRRWRDTSKLRRMCMTAIARRLEEDHPSKRFARTSYRVFSGSKEVLRCDHLVQEITVALHETMRRISSDESGTSQTDSTSHTPSQGSTGSGASSRPWSFVVPKKTFTGLFVRDSIRNGFRQLSRRITQISEDTPSSGSPMANSPSIDSEDSVGEIRRLVSALDGMKNNTVDYTLFCAAVLPEDVYCDEQRTAEAFDLLDFNKQGKLSPDGLKKAFQTKEAGTRTFAELIADFDIDGDGALDLYEFRQMLRGGSGAVGATRSAPAVAMESAPVVRGIECSPFRRSL